MCRQLVHRHNFQVSAIFTDDILAYSLLHLIARGVTSVEESPKLYQASTNLVALL